MKSFRYDALTQDGELVRGEVLAENAAAVIARLHAQALLPIGATERDAGKAGARRFRWRRQWLRGRELVLFAEQLARLLKAGLPLDRALTILVELADSRRLKRKLQSMLDRVRDGASLREALGQSDGFPETFLALVQAGELSGALQAVLAQSAAFLARSEAIRQKIVSAMVYPAILIAVAGLSVTLIFTTVLPQFEPMFREAGDRLPESTRLLLAMSQLLRQQAWLLLALAAAGVATLRAVFSRPAVRLACDRLLLRMPGVRHLLLRYEVGRFCRTLGVMLANGVAAPTALALAGQTMGSLVLAREAETVAQRFQEGEGLSTPLARSGYFPVLAIQMIRVGEETGRLDDMLGEVAALFDQEVQRHLERLLAALVPALTVAMGLLVALLVGAVLSALITVNALAV